MEKIIKVIIVISAIFLIAQLISKDTDDNIRLRVIASSDNPSDQEFKLAVTEVMLKIIENNDKPLKDLKTIQYYNDLINEKFSNAKIVVTYEKINYPAKSYQNKFIASGAYWTILVKIGEAKGKNWWSILYPEYFGLSLNERISFEDIEFRSYLYDSITK